MERTHAKDSAADGAGRSDSARRSEPRGVPALQAAVGNRVVQRLLGVQRDIRGEHRARFGVFTVDLRRARDRGASGAEHEREVGTIAFMPSTSAPESDSIRFVQVVRTRDVEGTTARPGSDVNWARIEGGAQADRDSMRTVGRRRGFYVDQRADLLATRSTVSPFYDRSGETSSQNVVGHAHRYDRLAAIMFDTPGGPVPMSFEFETSARASDTGFVYGTLCWGFTTRRRSGVVEVVGEHQPELRPGATSLTAEALAAFRRYWERQGKQVELRGRSRR